MNRKYELTSEYKDLPNGKKAYRIRALKNFADVKAGNLGGFVESENNLSHEGNCWAYDKSIIHNEAKISEDASVYDSEISGEAVIRGSAVIKDSQVYGSAVVKDYAKVESGSVICQNAVVSDKALVHGASVYGKAQIKDNVKLLSYSIDKKYGVSDKKGISVEGNAVISENAVVSGGAIIYKNAVIRGNAQISPENVENWGFDVPRIYGNVMIEGNVNIHAGCRIKDKVRITGETEIDKPVVISGNADIRGNEDYKALDVSYSTLYRRPDIISLYMSAFKCVDGSVKISGFGKTYPVDELVNYAIDKDPAHQTEYEKAGKEAVAYFEYLTLSETDLPSMTESEMKI